MRELSIYDGQKFVGTIKVADDGKKATAFDCNGKRVGSFPSDKDAIAAFNREQPGLQCHDA
jgi:hypothetical protein